MTPFEGPEEKYNRIMASNVIELYAPIVAEDMVNVAEALVATKKKSNIGKGKSLYRDIIITFTGPVYRSYVKKPSSHLKISKKCHFQKLKNKRKSSKTKHRACDENCVNLH